MPVQIGIRIKHLGNDLGNRPAVIAVAVDGTTERLSWAALADASARLERQILAAGKGTEVIAVLAHSSIDSIITIVAVLSAGLIVFPQDPHSSAAERERQFAVLPFPPVYLADLLGGSNSDMPRSNMGGYVLLTGGSTGVPKAVLRSGIPSYDPRKGPPLLLQQTGWRTGQTHLVVGPLYHAAPFSHLLEGLLSGNTLLLPEVFQPALVMDLLARYHVNWAQFTPSHMRILASLIREHAPALTTLRGILHTAAPCPPDIKRIWIDALGPDRIYEMYAATEAIGFTLSTGQDWLARPGTVGRGFLTRIRIYDDNGKRLSVGETGTVYMRSILASRQRGPWNSRQPAAMEGFATAGDLGRLDEDAYLYLAGRRDDLVIVGGENVFTGDVVSVILSHPAVADVAVLGVPDDLLGAKLVALIVPHAGMHLTRQEIIRYCLSSLTPYQTPMDIRMVVTLGRSASGKLQRDTLHRIISRGV